MRLALYFVLGTKFDRSYKDKQIYEVNFLTSPKLTALVRQSADVAALASCLYICSLCVTGYFLEELFSSKISVSFRRKVSQREILAHVEK